MNPRNDPRRIPEILAPAGDREALRAAVAAGADAVYFGLQGFNARARAANFDEAALEESLRELHAHGVRGYVTLNTLVFDSELPALERAVRVCANAGADAVIVQDVGVARLVRAVAPGLPVHASTQMTCTDAASVELAREAGASRVILARELSTAEIAAIRAATDVEIEVFVHGALCVAYSGQCLTSEAIGGRSANRGACAQACRLPYDLVVDGVVQDLGERAYLLSPQDLEASEQVPTLVELGVSSLKIEGRLKGPEYVAATTALYRRAVDHAVGRDRAPTAEERRAALQMYSRGSGPGFLAGVDHQRLVEARGCDHRGTLLGESLGPRSTRGRAYVAVRLDAPISRGDGMLIEGGRAGEGETGGRVWAVLVAGREVERAEAGEEALLWLGPERDLSAAPSARRVFKTSDPSAERAVLATLRDAAARVRIDVTVSGAIGESPVFDATSARGHRARVVGEGRVEAARAAPTTREILREKLGQLGETPFVLGELRSTLPDGAMLPLSSLKRARRALVAALETSLHHAPPTTAQRAAALLAATSPPARIPARAGLFVLCRTFAQAEAAVDAGADGVYLDFLELTGTAAAVRALRARGGVHVTLAPPRIRKPGEEKIDRHLYSLAPDAVLVRGLGALRDGAPDGVERIGDFSLNVTNSLTACALLERGLAAFTPSFDLDAGQLASLLRGPLAPWAEVVVHHPMPLFHMEHCVFAALMSEGRDYKTCGRPCERHAVSLRDRAGMDHPLEADVGCRNTLFHAAPQSAAGLVPELRAAGVRRFRIELVREDRDEVARIVGAYRALIEGVEPPASVWKTLRAEGRYGVVRGSLRVIS